MVRRFAFLASLAVASFLPSIASADETVWMPPVITAVQKGTPAPFAGVLLTPEAVAKVIAEAKDCPKRVEVEVDKARGEEKALGEKAVADAQSDAKRDKAILQAGIDQREGMIKDLNARLEKSEQSRGNTWLFAGGGLLTGATIVILSVVAVNAAN